MKAEIKFNMGEAKFSYRYGLGLIRLSGEIDFASYQKLENYINYWLKTNRCPVIFDLTNVIFMDNTGGIRLLIQTGQKLGFQKVAIVNANNNIERLLRLSRLTERIGLYKDFNQARDALAVFALANEAHKKSA